MASSRQLRLGTFMRPISIHTAAWRYPGALPDANFNFHHLKRFAQELEHAKFDAFFTWPTISPCSICRWTRSNAAPPSLRSIP
jgi:hypothetical protein